MEASAITRSVGEPAGMLWVWQHGDPLPALAPLPGLSFTATDDIPLVASLSNAESERLWWRFQDGQRPYVAFLGATPIGYGWSAAGAATFGQPLHTFRVPSGSRYLLDFATLPAWRGRGVYPRLLQAILACEQGDAERFWILHQRANIASARGIEKAGFSLVASIWFRVGGGFGLLPSARSELAAAGGRDLDLPLLATAISPGG